MEITRIVLEEERRITLFEFNIFKNLYVNNFY